MITIAITFFIGVSVGALLVKRKSIAEFAETSLKSLSVGSSVAVPTLLLSEPKSVLAVTEDVSEETKVRNYVRNWHLYLKPELIEYAIANADKSHEYSGLGADYYFKQAEKELPRDLEYGMDIVMRNYAKQMISASRRDTLGSLTQEQRNYLSTIKTFLSKLEAEAKAKQAAIDLKMWKRAGSKIPPTPPTPVRGTPVSR